ncbi:hypothetical protein BC833DRAFT_608573 [Globomyces pollinis-pini]|nr:hypothetical protein BC833DRAFT_608573 [Globomyces pollinis-pini]
MPGSWDANDDLTWRVSAVFAFIWVFSIGFESSIRFKANLFWATVGISLFLIACKLYLTVYYNELLISNPASAKSIYKILEYVNIMVYVSKAFGMYQRKAIISPTKYWDIGMLTFVASVSVLASSVCLLGNAGSCWVYSNPIQCVSLFFTIAYFDLYYVYSVMNKYNQEKSSRNRLQVLLPVFWTVMHSTFYMFGSMAFNYNFSNFYTNALWNFSSVMIPIVTLESNISTNVSSFVLSMHDKSVKSTHDSKWIEKSSNA